MRVRQTMVGTAALGSGVDTNSRIPLGTAIVNQRRQIPWDFGGEKSRPTPPLYEVP